MNSPLPILLIIALIIAIWPVPRKDQRTRYFFIDHIFILGLLGFADIVSGGLSGNFFIQL
jgi:hypothetical protein